MRRFNGWEPRQETTHEYANGVLIRSVTQVEPEWDDDERGWMLALNALRKGTCEGCGHPLIESMDPANQFRYRVDAPSRCHACTALSIAYEDTKKYKHPSALRYGAHLP